MTKYTVLVMHETRPGRLDKVRPLEAQDLLRALKEVTNLCKGDQDIYMVILHERVGNGNEYKMIMKSYDGKLFCVEEPSGHWEWETVVRNAQEVNGETVESFESPHYTFD